MITHATRAAFRSTQRGYRRRDRRCPLLRPSPTRSLAAPPARLQSSSSRCPTGASSVSPAATAARSPRAARASAASASTTGALSRVPHGYVGALAVRPDREEALLPCPARLRRPDVRHARMRSSLRLLPELVHVAVDPRPRGGRRAPRDVGAGELVDLAVDAGAPTVVSTLQRAAHHDGVGRRGFPEAKRARAAHRVRLQRQRDAAGARLHPAVDRLVQGRPEDRSTTSTTGSSAACSRTSSTRSQRDPRARLLGRDRDPRRPGLQRLRRGARTRGASSSRRCRKTIPWHMTAFHPDYKMTDRGATPAATLLRACEIGTAEGLAFVYAGNVPGGVGRWEDTRCPSLRRDTHRAPRASACRKPARDGSCPKCSTARSPGRWDSRVEGTSRHPGNSAARRVEPTASR